MITREADGDGYLDSGVKRSEDVWQKERIQSASDNSMG